MKVILTGINGTVAPVVAKRLEQEGYEVIAYDRTKTSTEDEHEIKKFIQENHPNMLMHFAMGNHFWTSILAKVTFELDIKYIYISTVSVFEPSQSPHPFTKTLVPLPSDEYGRYKKEGEIKSLKSNPNAYIARLSWQIGHDKGSNQMIDFLYKQMEEKGYIEASNNFYPSAAFMEDTANALLDMIQKEKGIYHLNSNLTLSFYHIVSLLKKIHPSFIIKQTIEPHIDVRMIDDDLYMPLLEDTIESMIN